jgi:ERF superfamily
VGRRRAFKRKGSALAKRKQSRSKQVDRSIRSRRREPTDTSTALVRRDQAPAQPEHPLAIIERVAKDPSVDVGKLRELIELQKDVMRIQAKVEFDKAFAVMQPQLPTITKRGQITANEKDASGKRTGKKFVQSRYARLGEDIQPFIKPILERHGFAIRFQTEWPQDMVRVIGILSHEAGHSERSTFEAPADKSDYRTHVQSLGSTVSYGRRYTTIDLLNLTVQGMDNDGRTSPPPAAERHPHADEPITEAQAKRFWTIARQVGRSDTEIKMWLSAAYGLNSTKEIRRGDYDAICGAVERPGPLPLPDREPGADDD